MDEDDWYVKGQEPVGILVDIVNKEMNKTEEISEEDSEDIKNLRKKFMEGYKKKKKQGCEFLKLLSLCLNFAEHPITLTKNMVTTPFHKRGSKGFILDDKAIDLFPEKIREEYRLKQKQFGVRLCLFDGNVYALPDTDYKYKVKK